MNEATPEESGPAKTKLNDLISRLNDVKYGAPPPSTSDIEAMIALAERLGLSTTKLIAAAEAAETAAKEAMGQTKVTPTNAVEESEKFFESKEMMHVLNMQEIRSKGATFEVDGKPPCISKDMAVSEADTIDQNYLASQRILKELQIREQEIFASRNFSEHETELDKILTQRVNHAKLQANHEYRRETNLTNDQLYSTNEIGTKVTKEISAKEQEAGAAVVATFRSRLDAMDKKFGVAPPQQDNIAKPRHTVEYVDRGALVSPPATPNVSQARSRGMSV